MKTSSIVIVAAMMGMLGSSKSVGGAKTRVSAKDSRTADDIDSRKAKNAAKRARRVARSK